jgi:rubrerythrin
VSVDVLLTAAAEIEHALMVQYPYAAYSVRVADPNQTELETVQNRLTQIAREEKGHLATVQNLLHLIGRAAEPQPGSLPPVPAPSTRSASRSTRSPSM